MILWLCERQAAGQSLVYSEVCLENRDKAMAIRRTFACLEHRDKAVTILNGDVRVGVMIGRQRAQFDRRK